MKFKTVFIICLFICSALIGAGLGFSKIYLDKQVKPTITLPETVVVTHVSSDIMDYIDYSKDASFMLTGYIRLDRSILLNCYDAFNEQFHCDDIMGDVRNILTHQGTCLSTINGTFSGEYEAPPEKEYPYAGKKYYNAPNEFAEAIGKSAISYAAMANDRVNDGDFDGLENTKRALMNNGVTSIGIADTYDNRFEYEDIDSEGIKIRVYSYTESIHKPLDKAYNYSVNMLNTDKDVDKLVKSVKDSKKGMCDIACVCISFANADNKITTHQREVTKRLLDAGADIVYATNPDIIEPMEIRKTKLKSGKVKYQFAFYSLGCLLSGATGSAGNVPKNSGILAKIHYDQDNMNTFVSEVSFAPTYCVSYPTVEDYDEAGMHVKVFDMGGIYKYVDKGGVSKGRIKVKSPRVNHPIPDYDSRNQHPTEEPATTEARKKSDILIPDITEAPATTTETPQTEATTEEDNNSSTLETGIARIFINNGFGLIRAHAAKKEQIVDDFYLDNLATSDFKTVSRSYKSCIDRLFSGTGYKYREKDGWFYLKP